MKDNIVSRPEITHKYLKKVRLLVSSICNHSCAFCHNEGQIKGNEFIDFNKLFPYLNVLRKYSSQITVSGGEPLQNPEISDIVQKLYSCDFDISLETAGDELLDNWKILEHLYCLHVSIISVEKGCIANNYNEKRIKKFSDIRSVHERFPNLKLSINIPVINIDIVAGELEAFIHLAKETNAKLKFINEFKHHRRTAKNLTTWYDRWWVLINEIEKYNFKYSEGDPREAEYINDEGVIIEFDEIPCASYDNFYNYGRCFDNMDLIIDTNLDIKLCRWQKGAYSLSKITDHYKLDDILVDLTKENVNSCPYETSMPPLIKFGKGIEKYIHNPHNQWPQYNIDGNDKTFQLINRNEISYLGRNNVVAIFENEFARFHDTHFALTTCSGTMSLFLAYQCLDFKNNAEIIIPIYSYPGTVTSLLVAGAKINFCDVDPLTGNIDLDDFKRRITKRTRGVIVTHMWGYPINMYKLINICNEHGIKIIEDCSHAIGTEIDGKKVGTFGDIGCFSLQSNKPVFAGEGGVLITNSQDIYNKAVSLSSLRQRMLDGVNDNNFRKYWDTGLGLKFKIHPLGAACALASLRDIENTMKQRKLRVKIISDHLSESNNLVLFDNNPTDLIITNRMYYTLKPVLRDELIPFRGQFVQNLVLRGLDAKIPDNKPIHRTELYNLISNNKENFTNADLYYNRIISLPSLTYEPIDLINYYGTILKEEVTRLRQ